MSDKYTDINYTNILYRCIIIIYTVATDDIFNEGMYINTNLS